LTKNVDPFGTIELAVLAADSRESIEIDKRLIRDRIIALKQKINEVQKQRLCIARDDPGRIACALSSDVHHSRAPSELPHLSRSDGGSHAVCNARSDNPQSALPGLKTHPSVLITDTVGFVQKLPTHLVAAQK
jgi:GTP-binding protein HflX